MSFELGRPVLVVDSDQSFQEQLKSQKQHPRFPVQFAETGAKAQTILSDRKVGLIGIFVSPSVTQPSWISVLRAAHMHRPATPIYILTGEKEKQALKDLVGIDFRKLGVRKQIEKPIPYKDMIQIITPIVLTFNPEQTIQRSKQFDELEAHTDLNFIPIRADDFLSGSQSLFDVFVRLSKDKFVKLLHAGEAFEPSRLEQYMKKGIQYFYIHREVQGTYMAYCDHIAKAILKMENVAVDLKLTQNLNLGEEVVKHLQNNGINEMNIAYANNFVSNVRNVSQQVLKEASGKSKMMQKFAEQAALYEHGVATSMLAGLLASTLRISSENPIQIVGMAGLFHDVALAGKPDSWLTEDLSQIDESEQKLYKLHPQAAVEELRKLKTFNEGALQAIEQHHMRLNGLGFPTRTGTTPVSRVSDIVGISEEYARALAIHALNPNFDVILQLQKNVFPGFPREIVRAFIDTFFPGQRGVFNS